MFRETSDAIAAPQSRTDAPRLRRNVSTNWYAIHAKPAREEIAAQSLESLELEILLPRLRTTRRVRGQSRCIIKPLFPGYLFAKFVPATHLHLIRYSRGVHNVVSAGLIPLPIDDAAIEDISRRLDANGAVEIMRQKFQQGDNVTISSGPFQGLSGVFERELDGGERVVILLEALQQARLLLERECLEPSGAA